MNKPLKPSDQKAFKVVTLCGTCQMGCYASAQKWQKDIKIYCSPECLPKYPRGEIVIAPQLRASLQYVGEHACKYHNVDLCELRTRRRTRPIVLARRWVMYASRLAGASLPRIGTDFDRDHTTIAHNIREAEYFLTYNKEEGRAFWDMLAFTDIGRAYAQFQFDLWEQKGEAIHGENSIHTPRTMD